MKQRAEYFKLAPDAMNILMTQETYLRNRFSEASIITLPIWELVKLRISQLNQCAFCVDMHSKEALSRGETIERLLGVSAWQDTPLYSKIERAALGWAEHITAGKPVDDATYESIVDVLGEEAVIDLTIAINAINSWNRIAKTFKPEVGSYSQ
ncbi:carboxymuconolactone decarboxylase family protein [Flocculibacter collagenilyticus]|uniref:carboxymuconolactone decarboxylase family protein n=1 Tax=Flocculibacter collagenilyticus TaxID=2744479 RepID=UPI0018F58E5F|nr:carboxymuconolactone decarboxylase family protein [Flocculibacter collagenilyticus]